MEGRGWVILPLLAAPLLAGCVAEGIDVALLVESGTTRTITGDELVEGSILVERNATLRVEDATLRVQQGILVERGGTLEVSGGRISFGGPYARQFLAVDGDAQFHAVTVEGVSDVAVSGRLSTIGGRVGTQCVRVLAGELESRATEWTLGDEPCDGYGWDAGTGRLLVQGRADFEEGALLVHSPAHAATLVQDGSLRLGNLTMDARSRVTLQAEDGTIEAWGVTFRVNDGQRFVSARDATVRLVDSLHPRNAFPPALSSGARFEVYWTLAVQAAAAPGGQALPRLNVTLASADGSTAHAVTDAKGEARFVALQYVYSSSAAQDRTGNPHVVRATQPGHVGATPALVLEAPGRATLPVVQAASVTNQLSGSHVASLESLSPESLADENPAARQSAISSTGP